MYESFNYVRQRATWRWFIENSVALVFLSIAVAPIYSRLAGWSREVTSQMIFILPIAMEGWYLIYVLGKNQRLSIKITLIALALPLIVNILWTIFT